MGQFAQLLPAIQVLQLSEFESQNWLDVQLEVVVPEPSALQVRSELPLHDLEFGVQT
jgi:hypothetical protein